MLTLKRVLNILLIIVIVVNLTSMSVLATDEDIETNDETQNALKDDGSGFDDNYDPPNESKTKPSSNDKFSTGDMTQPVLQEETHETVEVMNKLTPEQKKDVLAMVQVKVTEKVIEEIHNDSYSGQLFHHNTKNPEYYDSMFTDLATDILNGDINDSELEELRDDYYYEDAMDRIEKNYKDDEINADMRFDIYGDLAGNTDIGFHSMDVDEAIEDAYVELLGDNMSSEMIYLLASFDGDNLESYYNSLTQEEKEDMSIDDLKYLVTLEPTEEAEKLSELTGADWGDISDMIGRNNVTTKEDYDNLVSELKEDKQEIEDLLNNPDHYQEVTEETSGSSEGANQSELGEGYVVVGLDQDSIIPGTEGTTVAMSPELKELLEEYEDNYGMKYNENPSVVVGDVDFGMDNIDRDVKAIGSNSKNRHNWYIIEQVVFKIRRKDGKNIPGVSVDTAKTEEFYNKYVPDDIKSIITDLTGEDYIPYKIQNEGKELVAVMDIGNAIENKGGDTFNKFLRETLRDAGQLNKTWYTAFNPVISMNVEKKGVYIVELGIGAKRYVDQQKHEEIEKVRVEVDKHYTDIDEDGNEVDNSEFYKSYEKDVGVNYFEYYQDTRRYDETENEREGNTTYKHKWRDIETKDGPIKEDIPFHSIDGTYKVLYAKWELNVMDGGKITIPILGASEIQVISYLTE
ncbi:MAG: hypothetical protein ACLFMO_08290 [Eubacteriales bacterium]